MRPRKCSLTPHQLSSSRTNGWSKHCRLNHRRTKSRNCFLTNALRRQLICWTRNGLQPVKSSMPRRSRTVTGSTSQLANLVWTSLWDRSLSAKVLRVETCHRRSSSLRVRSRSLSCQCYFLKKAWESPQLTTHRGGSQLKRRGITWIVWVLTRTMLAQSSSISRMSCWYNNRWIWRLLYSLLCSRSNRIEKGHNHHILTVRVGMLVLLHLKTSLRRVMKRYSDLII